MKYCDNCFELNSDGATHCVICGESLTVAQTVATVAETAAGVRNDDAPAPEGSEDQPPPAPPEPVQDDDGGKADAPPLAAAADPDTAAAPPDAIVDRGTNTEQPPLAAAADPDTAAAPPDAAVDRSMNPEQDAGVPMGAEAKTPVPVPTAVAPERQPSARAEMAGSPVIQVYHDTEPRVVHTHAIVNDVTLVGREDPQRDIFPDLDLSKLDALGVSSKHASREHLRVLRRGGQLFIFIYPGSTGTQINKERIEESRYGKKLEVRVGDRLVLGGKIRLKLILKE